MSHRRTTLSLLCFGTALAFLLIAYLPALQTIPNGSENYYMIDVGETQIVLNRWGTLHATGYPLYVMIGSALVALLRAFGISAAEAPAVVSLFWGILTLTLIYALAMKLTRQPLIAAAGMILFGLTRTMWVHADIAEVYSMTVCLLALLLLIALWTPALPGRICWLALLGGVAVAHHRALIFAAPALVYAVWSDVWVLRKRPMLLLGLLGLGLLGLLPYAYMYLRAHMGAAWIYGDPGTLAGLIDQFMGKEANRFIGLPTSFEALVANFNLVNGVILTDVTLPGLVAGVVGLIIGVFTHRRAAITLILCGAAAYLFHVLVYTDILSALILMVTLSLAFGWIFLGEAVYRLIAPDVPMPTPVAPRSGVSTVRMKTLPTRAEGNSTRLSGGAVRVPLRPVVQPHGTRANIRAYAAAALVVVVAAIFGKIQYDSNEPFIRGLTSDPTGQQTIALAQHTPPGSTLMLAWGPRYFAVGFARDVLGLLPGVQLVDHKADYKAVLQSGELVTAEYTFYNQSVGWWEEQIGARVYLNAVEPDLVQISTEPEIRNDPELMPGVVDAAHRIDCTPDKVILRVAWHTDAVPTQNLSVFVKLLDDGGSVIAQDDQSAPVFGWRPLTSWVAQEVVRDVYSLPRAPDATAINYGLYERRADGSFNNVVEYTLPMECG